MKINLIFNGTETRIELQSTDEAERKILGVILGHSSLKIESHKQDDDYSMLTRPFNEPPTALTFHLVPPPELINPSAKKSSKKAPK